jgi:hypothetical protein
MRLEAELGVRAEDELGVELVEGGLTDVGIDEVESAKSGSVGERDDVVPKLDGYRRKGKGHSGEEGRDIGRGGWRRLWEGKEKSEEVEGAEEGGREGRR